MLGRIDIDNADETYFNGERIGGEKALVEVRNESEARAAATSRVSVRDAAGQIIGTAELERARLP